MMLAPVVMKRASDLNQPSRTRHNARAATQVMVGGVVAHLAATPEPRVRAFPSRGSSGYGSLS
jgi:hypothetical protein